MWSGMTLKRLKANAVPIPAKTQSCNVLNSDLSAQQLDMQCHASVDGTVSRNDSLEITGVRSAALDLEVLSEMSDEKRWEYEMEILAADVISSEHTYSRAELITEEVRHSEQLEQRETYVDIVSPVNRKCHEQEVSLKRDLRQTLFQFQKDNYLCDTVLIGEDGQVKVHSVVLAAATGVFKSALISCDSAREHVIVLPGMPMWLLKTVVRYVYCGEIQVSSDRMTNQHMSMVISVLTELGFNIMSSDVIASNTCELGENSVSDVDNPVSERQLSVISCDSEQETEILSRGSCSDHLISSTVGEDSMSVASSDIVNYIGSSEPSATRGAVDVRMVEVVTNINICAAGIEETNANLKLQNPSVIKKHVMRRGSSCDRLCHKCGQVFSSSKKYHIHKKVHLMKHEKAVCCPECGKKCANRTSLRSHMYLHTGERPHLCQHCGEGFIQRYSLEVHMTSHHLDVIKDDPTVVLFECEKCGDRFYNRFRFQRHLTSRCTVDIDSNISRTPHRFLGVNSEKPYACSKCTKRFRLRASLIIHDSVHTKHKHSTTSETSEVRNSDSEVMKNVCKTCAKWFKVNVQPTCIPTSAETCSSAEMCECSICGVRITGYQRDSSALDNCGKMSFAFCKTCGMKFETRGDLLIHKRSHTGGMPFHCSLCSYQAVNRSWLASHMRTHSGEMSYICDVCSKQFRRRSHLTRHMGIHTGEKPYTCPLCEKGYRNGLDLRLHCRRMHQFELPKYLGRRQLNDEEIDRLVAIDNQFNNASDRLTV